MHEIHTICNARLCPNNGVPTTSAIRTTLGPSLAQVFFEYSHPDTRKLLDLMEPLKSSKSCFPELDDASQDVPYLKNDDIVKANVHQNISDIGDIILQRFQKQIEENLRDRIEKESQQKFYLYQAKKRLEAEQYVEELHMKYENYTKIVQEQLEKKLEIEWANVVAKCDKDMRKAVAKERMIITRDIMRKMRIEMACVLKSLYKEFQESFLAQKENIIADFNAIMREKHAKLHNEMQEFETRISMDLHIQKHQLEMQSTADIIYLLCLERLRSYKEKHTIHTYFEKQIEQLHELIRRLDDVFTVMREEILNCHEEKTELEQKLSDITNQFQKFINFVFHATPGQAEYVLPVRSHHLINEKVKIKLRK